MFDYDAVASLFRSLCTDNGLPVPRLRPALPTDPCDYTDAQEVRINVEAARNVEPEWHARHVFGHYVCALHEWEPDGNQDWADPIADMIASLLTQAARDD